MKQHLPGGPVVRLAVIALACLAFAAGIVAAAASGAGYPSTTDTTATTDTVTTAPAVVTVTTERTATLTVTETHPATTAETATTELTLGSTTEANTGSGGGGFPTWAIVLIVALVVGLIAAVAFLLGRGKKHDENALDGRTRILDAAVASAVASGWTVESSSPLEAVIRRNDERTLLTVDDQGRVTRRPLGAGLQPDAPPDEPPQDWPSR